MRTSAQRSTQQRSEADYEAAWAKLAQVTGTQARRATLLALALCPVSHAPCSSVGGAGVLQISQGVLCCAVPQAFLLMELDNVARERNCRYAQA